MLTDIMDVNTLIKEKSEDFKLGLLTGHIGLDRKITVPDINRPGLAFTGFFEHFPYERVQVIGIGEYMYLKHMSYVCQIEILNKIFSHKDAVCCILTRNFDPTNALIKVLSDLNVPLLRTELRSSSLIGDLFYYLDGKLAPSIKIHGVMTSVYSLGVLIVGESAIGKSECALELVKRGHRLVADDIVVIKKRSGCVLVGSSPEIVKHLIEIRGIGIINIKDLFGIGNILDESRVELVIKLETWKSEKEYERIGIEEYYTEFLKIKVPELTIPVGVGRNLAVLVETASLNQRIRNKGCFTAKELDCTLQRKLE